MKYHYISFRMAKIKNNDDTKVPARSRETGSLTHCSKDIQWKVVWQFLLKIKHVLI